MTTATIYARFSSDRQSDKSIEDQVRLCRERAVAQGWRGFSHEDERGETPMPDEDDTPYGRGIKAGWSDEDEECPYAKGTPEYDQWWKGYCHASGDKEAWFESDF